MTILLMELAQLFEKGMEDIKRSSYSPSDKIRALISLHIRLTTENSYSIGLLTQDWKNLEEPHKSEFLTIRQKYYDDFNEIILEGMETGQIKPMNSEILLNSILSSVRWLYDWYSEDHEISPIELEIQISEILLKGFLKLK